MIRKPVLIGGVAAAVVAADQLTKAWALSNLVDGPRHVIWTFRLSLQFNTGIAFSQATGSTVLVTIVELAVVAGLVVAARRAQGAFSTVVFGLIMGGALGNLTDRLIRHHGGAVIDFIDPRWFPVFNVADAAVSIGVVLAVGAGMIGGEHRGRTGAAVDGHP
ncbi:MAG: signal peptidase II [Acidimicrobiales bacterium]